MTLSHEELETMLALAGKAPQGEWTLEDKNGEFAEGSPDWRFRPLRIKVDDKRILFVGDTTAHLPLAAFIAAANPVAVASLIRENMALREAVTEVHRVLCGTRNAPSYTVGADIEWSIDHLRTVLSPPSIAKEMGK